jgi:hypothetical protein
MKRILIGTIGLLCLLNGALAATIYVPQDYPNIGAAVSAASSGDEIIVSPGVYPPFGIDKRVTVRSTFDGSDWSIVENTIVRTSSQTGNLVLVQSAFVVDGAIIRGFTLTRDPVTLPPPNTSISARGIECGGADVTIEYCIIENCYVQSRPGDPPQPGSAIRGIEGTIQNNVIRNCRSDNGQGIVSLCNGLIRNNIIYANFSAALAICPADIVNNTMTTGVSVAGARSVVNNIFWSAGDFFAYTGPPPRNCIIKGYTGEGTDIITDDPKFIDPANGDFRLQVDSPAIDAGITTDGVKNADIRGVQRGLKGVAPERGDGSRVDIGAHEFLPRPIAVWLPNGGPDEIFSGDLLQVAWDMEPATAGDTIDLQLFDGETMVKDFGFFFSGTGAAESTVKLPYGLPTADTYLIAGISVTSPTLSGMTPAMTILERENAAPSSHWLGYR